MRQVRSPSYFWGIGILILFVLLGCSQTRPSDETPASDEIPIGYGSIPAEKSTGSVATVTAKDNHNSGAVHLQQLLSGQVAGVQVVSTGPNRFRVVIRGGPPGSYNPEPLYVLDGIPQPRGIDVGIDPSTVSRIVILKDAAAAVYGSRGANGVVLIETKRNR